MAYRSEEDREHRVLYAREVRAYRKSVGMCIRCGNDKIAVNSTTMCLKCLDERREYQAKRFAAMTPEEKQRRKERNNARRREKQAKHRSEGVCTICGKPAYNGKRRCMEHFLYFKRYDMEVKKRMKKGYAELGLCRICGGECVPGKKFCPEHYQQKVEAIKYADGFRDKKKHPWNQDNDAAFMGKDQKAGENNEN